MSCRTDGIAISSESIETVGPYGNVERLSFETRPKLEATEIFVSLNGNGT